MKPLYSEEEANVILRRAIENTPPKSAMSLEQLLKIGAELGIPADALRQADAEHASQGGRSRKYAAFLAHESGVFRNHVYSFLGAGTFVFLLNDFTSWGFKWLLLPLLGWSMGLLYHAARVYDRDSQQHVKSFFGYLRATQTGVQAVDDTHRPPPPA